MNSEGKILIALLLNLAFSAFEFLGGLFTGSVAILSDALHDLGDAAGIALSYAFEKKSKKGADAAYTYGYGRYSVMGSVITTVILLVGSLVVFYNAIGRIITPMPIHYNGMILFALVGVVVNGAAVFFTHEGASLNQRAVSLHLLEDVLGWVAVLLGALIMKWTDFVLIDPILSILVAGFIFVHGAKNLKASLTLFLEKTPGGIDVDALKASLLALEGVEDVHHIHIWSVDGQSHCATMHIVISGDAHEIKHYVRDELKGHGVEHCTLELETMGEHCHEDACHLGEKAPVNHHHHH